MNNFTQIGGALNFVAPYAVASGAGFKVGNFFAVAVGSAGSGDMVTGLVVGVHQIAKDTSTFADGDAVYWDNTAKKATSTTSGNMQIGVATLKVPDGTSRLGGSSGDATVSVRLSGSFQTAYQIGNITPGTDGQLLVGQTGVAPVFETVAGDATMAANGTMTLAEAVATRTVKVSLTNSEIKNLRATPKTLVAAQSGKVLEFVSATLELKAGANVLTESTANLAVKYNNGSGVAVSDTIEATGFIDQAANTITRGVPVKDAIVASSAAINKALVLHNLGAGEYGGNAAADATMDVFISYRVLSIAA